MHLYDITGTHVLMRHDVPEFLTMRTKYTCRWCHKQLHVAGPVFANAVDPTFCPEAPVAICAHGRQHDQCPFCAKLGCRCESCQPGAPFIDF